MTAYGVETRLGNLYPLVMAYWTMIPIVAVVNLIRKYIVSQGITRQQIRLIFIGFGFYASTATVGAVVLPIFWNTSRYFFTLVLGCLVFVGLTVFAIVKHRLFDIRLVAARSISYLLLLVILTVIYAGGLLGVAVFITKQTSLTGNLIISTVLALTIAFTFQPLRTLLERATDILFFKGRYSPNNLLYVLSKSMATTLTLSTLTYEVLDILVKQIKITKTAIVTLKNKQVYIAENPHTHGIIKITNSDYEELKSQDKLLIFDEIEEGSIKSLLRKKEISVVLPLHTKKDFIGFLMLGEKSSGDIYFDDDINILKILGPEMAVALQNAQRFEEINQFNATLQEKVKRATKELSLVNDKLQKLDLLKDEFITIASHDLRSPLATTKGFVWMAVKDIGKSSPSAKEHLDKALESTERSISLVNDMLDVSRIEAGRIELRPEKLNICQMASEVAEELANIAKDKKIEVSTNCKGNAFVKVDKERIHRVLTNLVGNAIKFTPELGKVGISVTKNGKMAEVAITDSGIGIKKDDLPKLFTKFGKIETSSKIPVTTGTGLGLYISKNIVELSHGKIWVKSTPGKGSVFTFSLPIA